MKSSMTSQCRFDNSVLISKQIVGIADDDTMYHILVYSLFDFGVVPLNLAAQSYVTCGIIYFVWLFVWAQ